MFSIGTPELVARPAAAEESSGDRQPEGSAHPTSRLGRRSAITHEGGEAVRAAAAVWWNTSNPDVNND